MNINFLKRSKQIFASICLLSVVQLFANGPFPAINATWDQKEINRQRQAGLKLQNDIHQAIKDGKKSFKVPKDIYRFDKAIGDREAFFEFLNVKNFELDGSNSEFYFENYYSGFSIRKSKNITIKNLLLDYDPLPFKQGEIIDIDYDKNTLTFRPEKGYENNLKDYETGRGILFDSKTRILKAKQIGFRLSKNSVKENGDLILNIHGFYNNKAKELGMEKGDLLVTLVRYARLFRTESSENVACENLDVYAAAFSVFVATGGNGGHSYVNCRIIKRPGTNRLVAANADGFNSTALWKGPLIENCVIDTNCDDFVNLHGKYYRIYDQISPTEFIVEKFPTVAKGETTLSFLENDSWKFLGERKVVKVEPTTVIPSEEKIKAINWKSSAKIKAGKKIQAFKLTIDKAVDVKSAAIFACNDFVCGGGIIRNCNFKNSIARGIRLQSRDTLIEGNTIERTTTGSILTTGGQPDFWAEAITAANLICRNNTFIAANYGYASDTAPTPAAIQFIAPGPANEAQMVENVEFTNNRILKSGGLVISVKNARNILIKDNEIGEYNLMDNPEVKKYNKPIVVVDSENITIQNK